MDTSETIEYASRVKNEETCPKETISKRKSTFRYEIELHLWLFSSQSVQNRQQLWDMGYDYANITRTVVTKAVRPWKTGVRI